MKTFATRISQALHWVAVAVMLAIAVLLTFLVVQKFGMLVTSCRYGAALVDHKPMLEDVFVILLLVEIIAAIKLFFKNNFHFPLRFLVYIAITDVVRHILVTLDDPFKIILLAGATLLLVGALVLLEIRCRWVPGASCDRDFSL